MQSTTPGAGVAGRRRGLVTFSLCLSLLACNVDPYLLGGGGGDGGGGDGGGDGDGAGGDGGGGGDDAGESRPDACVPFPEACNQADDDCDGMIDEDFDLDVDNRHCGGCGQRCAQPNAAGTCSGGACSYVCQPGFVDTDVPPDPSDGCEYACTPTGDEVCDLADNDCDTRVDEGLALDTDEDNCGRCGNRCLALNADPVCAAGACTWGQCDGAGTCTVGVCDPGFADLVPAIAGCETQCPVFPTQPEACNGVDDDCDGTTDELPIVGLGAACGPTDVGACSFGATACSFGVPVCVGYVGPTSEVCNDLDDDCDGTADDGFDKLSDPRTCGGCTPCNLPSAIEGCSAGTCTVVGCLPGFFDADGLGGNGCEYACSPTGPETCDGVDNDCDGLVDGADPQLTAPANFCRSQGSCSGAAPTCGTNPCTGAVEWRCSYGAGVEVDACGAPLLQEARCDSVDGDCDGRVDESYPLKGTACADAGVGECRGEGTLVCAAGGAALSCNITTPGASPGPELCDGDDDDCDGTADEGAADDMVQIGTGPSAFYIYRYEAARPSATATSFGTPVAGQRSCSKPGVLPWRSVSHLDAAAACAAAGKRLCSEAEWELACAGPTGLAYPYGNGYDADACNGADVDLDCTAPDTDEVSTTGDVFVCTGPVPPTSACVSPGGAVDMSGNLKEWTSTPVGGSAFRVKGGAYDNIGVGLTCDRSFIAFSPDLEFPNLGFRCCSTTPN